MVTVTGELNVPSNVGISPGICAALFRAAAPNTVASVELSARMSAEEGGAAWAVVAVVRGDWGTGEVLEVGSVGYRGVVAVALYDGGLSLDEGGSAAVFVGSGVGAFSEEVEVEADLASIFFDCDLVTARTRGLAENTGKLSQYKEDFLSLVTSSAITR